LTPAEFADLAAWSGAVLRAGRGAWPRVERLPTPPGDSLRRWRPLVLRTTWPRFTQPRCAGMRAVWPVRSLPSCARAPFTPGIATPRLPRLRPNIRARGAVFRN